MPSSSPRLPQRIKKKRAVSSLMAASKSHTLIYPPHTVVSECWRGKHQPTNSSTGSWAFCVDSFPLEAQFMSVYSTGWVTFRLWHLFLFRYHVWFLSNQLAPFPLTSPIREPAYYTSRTGQTEINLGQISAWGNFNEGKKKKKKKWYKNNSEGFCSRQFCLVQVEWGHRVRVLKLALFQASFQPLHLTVMKLKPRG